MPAGVFCALLASASPISKRLTETLFLKALDILNGIYFSPEHSRRIRTATDGGGSQQQRCFYAAKTLFIGFHTNCCGNIIHYRFSECRNERLAGITVSSPALDDRLAFLQFIFSRAIYYLLSVCFCGMDAGKTYKLKGGEKV